MNYSWKTLGLSQTTVGYGMSFYFLATLTCQKSNGVFASSLDQINERPNENGTFLDLVFTNVPVDMAVEGAEPPLLKLDRHQSLRNRNADLLL
jgi:hypothetical protein